MAFTKTAAPRSHPVLPLRAIGLRQARAVPSSTLGGIKRAVCSCNQTAAVTAIVRLLCSYATANGDNAGTTRQMPDLHAFNSPPDALADE